MKAVSRAALAAFLALTGAACASNEQAVDYSDAGLKARVEVALRGHKDIDARYVSIDVENGTVTVSGIVPDSEQRVLIDRIIKRIPGVDALLDNLLVQD